MLHRIFTPLVALIVGSAAFQGHSEESLVPLLITMQNYDELEGDPHLTGYLAQEAKSHPGDVRAAGNLHLRIVVVSVSKAHLAEFKQKLLALPEKPDLFSLEEFNHIDPQHHINGDKGSADDAVALFESPHFSDHLIALELWTHEINQSKSKALNTVFYNRDVIARHIWDTAATIGPFLRDVAETSGKATVQAIIRHAIEALIKIDSVDSHAYALNLLPLSPESAAAVTHAKFNGAEEVMKFYLWLTEQTLDDTLEYYALSPEQQASKEWFAYERPDRFKNFNGVHRTTLVEKWRIPFNVENLAASILFLSPSPSTRKNLLKLVAQFILDQESKITRIGELQKKQALAKSEEHLRRSPGAEESSIQAALSEISENYDQNIQGHLVLDQLIKLSDHKRMDYPTSLALREAAVDLYLELIPKIKTNATLRLVTDYAISLNRSFADEPGELPHNSNLGMKLAKLNALTNQVLTQAMNRSSRNGHCAEWILVEETVER